MEFKLEEETQVRVIKQEPERQVKRRKTKCYERKTTKNDQTNIKKHKRKKLKLNLFISLVIKSKNSSF